MNITLYRSPFRTFTALAPFYRPLSIMDEIEEIARDFSRRIGFGDGMLAPQTDVYEEKGELVMKTELPGISEKDLEVTLEGDMLTVKAEKKDEAAEDATHHTRERYHGTYFRSMSLPFHVDGDKVSANFVNGVLELRLPRSKEAQAKKIEVKAQLPQGQRRRKKKAK